MMITPYYLSLVDPKDPDDPIGRMCIPSLDEFDPGGSFDTSGEASNTKMEGLRIVGEHIEKFLVAVYPLRERHGDPGPEPDEVQPSRRASASWMRPRPGRTASASRCATP